MNDSKISVRYARALFQSALEKHIIDRVYKDITFISELCRIQEVRDLLVSPIIPPAKKTEIMHDMLKKEIDKTTLSFVDLVISNSRENFLDFGV